MAGVVGSVNFAASPYDSIEGQELYVDASGGTVTVNLPASPPLAAEIEIVLSSATGSCIIDGNGNNIDGVAAVTLFVQYQAARFVWFGGEWHRASRDLTATHIDIADEYKSVPAKGTPAGADWLLIEDSADSFKKKRVLLSGLPSAPPGIVVATASPVTVGTGDDYVLVKLAAPGPVAVSLPPIAGHSTKTITIKDRTGDAQTNNITITPDGAETIDGDASLVLQSNFASVTLVGSGTDWSIV